MTTDTKTAEPLDYSYENFPFHSEFESSWDQVEESIKTPEDRKFAEAFWMSTEEDLMQAQEFLEETASLFKGNAPYFHLQLENWVRFALEHRPGEVVGGFLAYRNDD